MASGKRVGSLLIDIAMNIAKAVSDIDKLNKKFDNFGRNIDKTFKRAGATIGGVLSVLAVQRTANALSGMYKEIVNTADATAKLAGRVGISTEALSGFEYAAKLAGVETNMLYKGLVTMQDSVADAARGTGEAKDSLESMGLSAQALMQMSPDRMFLAISDAMAKVTNQNERMNYANDIFGKRMSALLTLMQDGKEGIRAYIAEAERFGVIISAQTAKDMEEASDSLDRLGFAWKGVKLAIAKEAAPALTTAINEVALKIADLRDETSIRLFANAMVEAFRIASNAALLFGETIVKVMVMRDQIQSMLPESWGYGASDISLLEQKLAEYDNLVTRLTQAVNNKRRTDLNQTAIDQEIENLRRKIAIVKSAIEFLEGKVAAAQFETMKPTIDIHPGGAGAASLESEMQKRVDAAKGWSSIGAGADYQIEKLTALQEALNETAYYFSDTYEKALDYERGLNGVALATDAVTGVSLSMEYGFSSAFQNIITGAGSLQDAFAGMGRSIIGVITDMIAKLLVMQLLMKGLGLLFSAGGGGAASVQKDLGPMYNIGDIGKGFTFSAHKGGIVTPHGIQRYHAGGAVRLRPDEVPAILQTGEQVIPRGGSAVPNVEVNVINNGTPQKVTQRTTRIDQRRMVVDLILEDMGENPETGRRMNNLLPRR